jgi:hypothetical protein
VVLAFSRFGECAGSAEFAWSSDACPATCEESSRILDGRSCMMTRRPLQWRQDARPSSQHPLTGRPDPGCVVRVCQPIRGQQDDRCRYTPPVPTTPSSSVPAPRDTSTRSQRRRRSIRHAPFLEYTEPSNHQRHGAQGRSMQADDGESSSRACYGRGPRAGRAVPGVQAHQPRTLGTVTE